MIKIPKNIVDDIFAQGKDELPIEACGYLAGKDGIVQERYPLTNVDQSPEHFTLDPNEQFDTYKKAKAKGLNLIAVYHTHPETPARPSQEDIKLAFDPVISYVIASISHDDIKSFKIKDGEVTKEELELI